MTEISNTEQIIKLQAQVFELQMAGLAHDIAKLAEERRTGWSANRKIIDDHEKRMRKLEESSTKVNTLIWLVTGGGALSAINLFLFLSK